MCIVKKKLFGQNYCLPYIYIHKYPSKGKFWWNMTIECKWYDTVDTRGISKSSTGGCPP